MDSTVTLWLPWPPTINSYYKPVRSALYLSKKGRQYRELVEEYVNEQIEEMNLDERLLIETTWFPPDHRARDLDNYNKALLDALTHCKLWDDDSLIDQHFQYRGETIKGGAVKIEINGAGPIISYQFAKQS